jgi:hypothetical protein
MPSDRRIGADTPPTASEASCPAEFSVTAAKSGNPSVERRDVGNILDVPKLLGRVPTGSKGFYGVFLCEGCYQIDSHGMNYLCCWNLVSTTTLTEVCSHHLTSTWIAPNSIAHF